MDVAAERQGRASARHGNCGRQAWTTSRSPPKLGVSKSSVSLWVRDLPRPPRLSYEECCRRSAEGVRRYWAVEGPLREAKREAVSAAAAAQIGELSDREILIAGAIAYWCEGAKNKPYRRSDRVQFVNSDPGLIRLFLRFLDAAGVDREMLIYRVQIHQSANADAAQRFWLDVTQADRTQFRRPSLKRHNPSTTRKNTGDGYHGCLRIDCPAQHRPVPADRRLGSCLGRCRRPRTSHGSGPEPDLKLPGEDSNLGQGLQSPGPAG